MTSSLRSRFDFFDRRFFCLAADRLTVQHWRSGELTEKFVFDLGVSAQTAFDWHKAGGVAEGFTAAEDSPDTPLARIASYLEQTANTPAYLLVDLVEEEFRQDTVPHVFGSDRRALIQRKITRLFRNSPFYNAMPQGRESEGRRDDIYLFAALTNPDIVLPLVELFERYKVPLAGIYSVPILSRLLLPILGATKPNVLLVSLHAASGLRQTFFRDGELKISRLAKMPRLGTVPYAQYMLQELDKIRRYLNSLRMISREAPLSIYILTTGDLLADLKERAMDSEQAEYHLEEISDIARQLGISGALTTPYSDVLFAQLLLANRPKNHYAPKPATRYYGLYRTRIATITAGVLLLLGSSVWSGFNFIEGVSLRELALDADQKAAFYEARYQIAHQRLPQTPVDANAIKTAVEVVDKIASYKARPLPLMLTVSRALDAFPVLQLDRIEWIASTDPLKPVVEQTVQQQGSADKTAGAGQANATPAPAIRPHYYQIAEIGGYLAPFDGNYREALAQVNRFAEALRAQTGVYDVKVLSQPLDLSSSASLEGMANQTDKTPEAKFSVRLVLGVGNESG